MNTSNQARVLRCRLSAWILTTLSILWTGVSIVALNWLESVSDWGSLGPMEWLCLFLVGIHVALVLATVWIWLRPKSEVLVFDTSLGSDRMFGAACALGLAGIFLSGRLDGWFSILAAAVGSIAFCAATILLLRGIRAARRLARRGAENGHGNCS